MGCKELEEYAQYAKPLANNDIIKANNMLQNGIYSKELVYMLSHNCKLEQEIVSWMRSGKEK